VRDMWRVGWHAPEACDFPLRLVPYTARATPAPLRTGYRNALPPPQLMLVFTL
jgi:hypothetical protein